MPRRASSWSGVAVHHQRNAVLSTGALQSPTSQPPQPPQQPHPQKFLVVRVQEHPPNPTSAQPTNNANTPNNRPITAHHKKQRNPRFTQLFELVQKTILPPNCRSSGNFVLKCPSIQNSKSHENHHLTPHTRRYAPYPPHRTPSNTTNHPQREIAADAATSGNFAARAAISRQLLTPRITPTPTLCSTLMRCKD